jgi:hypothetical protein
MLFQEDLLARNPFASPGGLFDRTGGQWIVVDVDGTRCAARQRALPQAESLPAPHRRFDYACTPGYQGRKRGEVVRTRTVILQAHTHQFLGTFGGPGNGDYRGELLRAIGVITSYATKCALPTASVLLRLDGLYGDAAPLIDVLTAGLGVIARSRDYHLLDLEVVQQVLACPPDQVSIHPESGMTRALYDCPAVPLTPTGPEIRLVVATHALTCSSPKVGVERDGTVYELFVSTLPRPAFTASDVLDLYLHRGSFETVLADEDDEQDSDRWYSHMPCGQEFAQILAQWIWNVRLELGQQLSSTELRTTEFALALETEVASKEESVPVDSPAPSVVYGPPQWARPSFTHGFPGSVASTGTHSILGTFCAARVQRVERMVNESRRPSGKRGDAWLTRSQKTARPRLSAQSLNGLISSPRVVRNRTGEMKEGEQTFLGRLCIECRNISVTRQICWNPMIAASVRFPSSKEACPPTKPGYLHNGINTIDINIITMVCYYHDERQ